MATRLNHVPPPPQAAEDRHFSTDHLQDDLRGRSVRGGAATAGAQAARFLIKFASVPVLARLLTPADFGLIAMVTAVTGFVAMFKDAGLSTATVQRAEINHGQISTLFWINVALSVTLILVTAALAPGIAWFYGEPRLVGITLVVAGMFLFSGLTIQHQALLRRQMRFGTLGGITIACQLVGVTTGITAAALGAGYWALVYAMAAQSAANAVLVWAATGWRPGLPRRGTGVRPMLAFGGNLLGSQFLAYVRRNFDNLLLGATWGAAALGMYSKAYSLLLLPIRQINSPVSAVAIPTLSRLQTEPERFRRYYCRGMELMVALGMPMVALCFVAAEPLVLTLLGRQWTEAIPIFRALGPAAFAGTINTAGGWVFVALGRTDKQLRANICSTVAILLAFCVGLQWGPFGVAVAFSIAFCVMRIPILMYAYHGTVIRLSDLGRLMWRPATASLSAAVLVAAASSLLTPTILPVFKLATMAAAYTVCYLMVFAILPGGRSFLLEARRLLLEFRRSSFSLASGEA